VTLLTLIISAIMKYLPKKFIDYTIILYYLYISYFSPNMTSRKSKGNFGQDLRLNKVDFAEIDYKSEPIQWNLGSRTPLITNKSVHEQTSRKKSLG
jgi:hypothetical protein